MTKKQDVIRALNRVSPNIKNVLNFDFNSPQLCIFDFDEKNKDLMNLDIVDTQALTKYIFGKMEEDNTNVAIGRYGENRTIYARSALFSDDKNPRTVHLGIDIFAEPGTPVFAPLDGKVHSFQNNDSFGDYGPTIILEHHIENVNFCTLYGHLSLDSIERLETGRLFTAGDQIARVGESSVNGNWPPHLHFQIVTDMLGKKGDFPGVCSVHDKEKFLDLCPDPNLILNINCLRRTTTT